MKTKARTLCVPMTALLLLVFVTSVAGHGFLTAPKVVFFTHQEDVTAYSATIDGQKALPVPDGMHYGWGPSLSTEAFTAAFGNSSYKTLREFVMKYQTMQPSASITPECGRTKSEGVEHQPLPDKVVWQHGEKEGFTLSHEGPCEVWCDDERVFVEKNCAKRYPNIPAVLPYERTKCEGKKRLQMVWLALHQGTEWQVYMNCAPISAAMQTATITPTNKNTASHAGSVSSLIPSMVPGTVKPSPGQGDEATTPAPTTQVLPSKTPSQPQASTPSSTSMTIQAAPLPNTNAPTGQVSPAEGTSSRTDDDDSDCATKKTAFHIRPRPRPQHPFSPGIFDRFTAKPRPKPTVDGNGGNTKKPATSLEVQQGDPSYTRSPLRLPSTEDLEKHSIPLRQLKAANPTPQPTKPSTAPVEVAEVPNPAPTKQPPQTGTPQHQHRKTSAPVSTSKTPKPTQFPKTRAPGDRESSTEGSGSNSGNDDDCGVKPAIHIGWWAGHHHLPSSPPLWFRPKLIDAVKVDRDVRPIDSRQLAATTPTPQVITWKNGLQEVIAPHIAEKARADFEANEKKIESWRAKVKKVFGYI